MICPPGRTCPAALLDSYRSCKSHAKPPNLLSFHENLLISLLPEIHHKQTLFHKLKKLSVAKKNHLEFEFVNPLHADGLFLPATLQPWPGFVASRSFAAFRQRPAMHGNYGRMSNSPCRWHLELCGKVCLKGR